MISTKQLIVIISIVWNLKLSRISKCDQGIQRDTPSEETFNFGRYDVQQETIRHLKKRDSTTDFQNENEDVNELLMILTDMQSRLGSTQERKPFKKEHFPSSTSSEKSKSEEKIEDISRIGEITTINSELTITSDTPGEIRGNESNKSSVENKSLKTSRNALSNTDRKLPLLIRDQRNEVKLDERNGNEYGSSDVSNIRLLKLIERQLLGFKTSTDIPIDESVLANPIIKIISRRVLRELLKVTAKRHGKVTSNKDFTNKNVQQDISEGDEISSFDIKKSTNLKDIIDVETNSENSARSVTDQAMQRIILSTILSPILGKNATPNTNANETSFVAETPSKNEVLQQKLIAMLTKLLSNYSPNSRERKDVHLKPRTTSKQPLTQLNKKTTPKDDFWNNKTSHQRLDDSRRAQESVNSKQSNHSLKVLETVKIKKQKDDKLVFPRENIAGNKSLNTSSAEINSINETDLKFPNASQPFFEKIEYFISQNVIFTGFLVICVVSTIGISVAISYCCMLKYMKHGKSDRSNSGDITFGNFFRNDKYDGDNKARKRKEEMKKRMIRKQTTEDVDRLSDRDDYDSLRNTICNTEVKESGIFSKASYHYNGRSMTTGNKGVDARSKCQDQGVRSKIQGNIINPLSEDEKKDIDTDFNEAIGKFGDENKRLS